MVQLLSREQFTIVLITSIIAACTFSLNKYICNSNVKMDKMYKRELKAVLISTFVITLIKDVILNIID